MSDSLQYAEWGEVRLSPSLQEVPSAIKHLRGYFLARGMSDQALTEWELAATEALNNAIEHGCRDRPDATVIARWKWEGEDAVLEVQDPGRFEGAASKALPDDLYAERGRGLFLMHEICKSVKHEQNEWGHLLILHKEVGPISLSMSQHAEMVRAVESMANDLSNSYETVTALFLSAECLGTSNDPKQFAECALCQFDALENVDILVRFLSDDGTMLSLIDTPRTSKNDPPKNLLVGELCLECEAFQTSSERSSQATKHLGSGDPLRKMDASAFVCPIVFRNKTIGVLTALRSRHDPIFDANVLSILRVVALYLGVTHAMASLRKQRDKQRRIEQELDIAASIQMSLLPATVPSSDKWEVMGYCQPARHVGGDYYDILTFPDGSLLMVIADVMGKGVPAALVATVFRTFVRSSLSLAATPDRLLREINRQMYDDLVKLEMFVTAQFMYVEPDARVVSIASAGHCPPFLYRKAEAKTVALMDVGGPPIGIDRAFRYEIENHTLDGGDTLAMLTDGLYEVCNAKGKMLGIESLAELWAEVGSLPLSESCETLLARVGEFASGTDVADDQTLVIYRCQRAKS